MKNSNFQTLKRVVYFERNGERWYVGKNETITHKKSLAMAVPYMTALKLIYKMSKKRPYVNFKMDYYEK